jgi:hypothetical protein
MVTIVTVLLYPLTFIISHIIDCLDTELSPEMVALITGPES